MRKGLWAKSGENTAITKKKEPAQSRGGHKVTPTERRLDREAWSKPVGREAGPKKVANQNIPWKKSYFLRKSPAQATIQPAKIM